MMCEHNFAVSFSKSKTGIIIILFRREIKFKYSFLKEINKEIIKTNKKKEKKLLHKIHRY